MTVSAAKHEVLVSGWMLQPEICLAYSEGQRRVTLLELLSLKACEGVVVRVMIFRPLESFFPTGSEHAEKLLGSFPNIQVIRHSQASMSSAVFDSESNVST